MRWLLNLFGGFEPMYAPDNGGEGGTGTEGGEGAGTEGGEGKATGITFKDEAALMARMGRHTKTEQDKIAKEAGYESHEAMLTDLKARQGEKEKQKTDLEREREARTKAEQRATEALATANTRLIKAEVKATAADLEIVDADAAHALMSMDGVEVDDKGNVKGVKESLTKLLKDKPYLKAAPAGAQKNGGDFSKKGDEGKGTGSLRDAIAAKMKR